VVKFAGVIVNNESVSVDKIFKYKIPYLMQDIIEVGFRVKVPFGKNNKKMDAFILYITEECEFKNQIKEISDICEDFPMLNKEDIKVINLMHEKYLSTYINCIKLFIPTGIMKGNSNKIREVIITNESLNEKFNKSPYTGIYDIVINNNALYEKAQLSKKFNLSISSINTMIKHGFLKSENIIEYRYNKKSYPVFEEITLNSEQLNAFNTIKNTNFNKFLIHGITGSGKTEIYMQLVSLMISQGKSSIILVPEISLTPQIVERFKGRFGQNISVFHSKLSDGERFDEWMRVKTGKVKLAIGARSAIFLPFANLGLIVIDEEHEGSYKSDSDPKYITKEIAEMKSDLNNCKVVLGSATPSIDSYYQCNIGNYKLIKINKRANNAVLPKIEIVDMREELLNNNKSILSKALYDSINSTLQNKQQIILFLNRRGFSSFISCRNCGYVFKCENCSISLTYHSDKNIMLCHYCGKSQPVKKVCPKCGSHYVKYFGIGTEKVEQEINKLFPSAKTIRMDLDTTRKKDSYEIIYNTFKNGGANVLIGTQMIAKGFDFKNVTLVGIIAADLSLNLPDYRSNERTYQLITQVSGRAGRGLNSGKVIVQTYNPQNYSIRYSAENDYDSFYNEEINIRKNMEYPPFTNILSITMSSKIETLLLKKIQEAGNVIKGLININENIKMLGPCPCLIAKIKDNYRWQIIVKGNFNNNFVSIIKITIYDLLKNVYNDIRMSVDINPNNLF
jgi:primosomal protein N' (replication factor Y) (superfamily II helicase)